MNKGNSHAGQRGFTLIELMIVVAIIAIFAAIAYPSYQRAILKSRRADAKTALLDLASRQERFFTTHNAYGTKPSQLGYLGETFPVDVQVGDRAYYKLNVTVNNAAGTYGASAVPLGGQAADACGTYTLDNTGAQGNNPATVTGCW